MRGGALAVLDSFGRRWARGRAVGGGAGSGEARGAGGRHLAVLGSARQRHRPALGGDADRRWPWRFLGEEEKRDGEKGRGVDGLATRRLGWGPCVGIFLHVLGLAGLRSSIFTSQPVMAEMAFLHEVGMAEKMKPGYQTTEKWIGRGCVWLRGYPSSGSGSHFFSGYHMFG